MSKNSLKNCICRNEIAYQREFHISEFTRIRDNCAALKKILFPDKVWASYQNFPSNGVGQAGHFPMSFVAYQRGVLFKLTSPIHHFLLDENGEIRSDINPNYLSDLRENWLIDEKGKFRKDELRRHERWSGYTGKLVELLCAYWLQYEKDWEIRTLEAWKKQNSPDFYSPDIESEMTNGKICAIEVKYIGIENEMFLSFLDHKARGYSDGDIVTFILCKLYKAAKQLENSNLKRVTFLVIDNISWSRVEKYWSENFIDWKTVELNKESEVLSKFKRAYPNVENDLHKTIGILSEFWVIVMTGEFTLKHKFTVHL